MGALHTLLLKMTNLQVEGCSDSYGPESSKSPAAAGAFEFAILKLKYNESAKDHIHRIS